MVKPHFKWTEGRIFVIPWIRFFECNENTPSRKNDKAGFVNYQGKAYNVAVKFFVALKSIDRRPI
jgi:hypothetical protein